MNASDRSHQNLSEAILTLFALCERIVKFCHTLLVRKNETIPVREAIKDVTFSKQKINNRSTDIKITITNLYFVHTQNL